LTASVKTVPAGAAPDEPLLAERGVSPAELLWDLVFVFAVTQVGTLLSRELSWAGFGRSILVLALIWWAWSAFVWVANAEDAEAPAFLLTLLAALVLIFISGLAIPHAFGGQATLFAVTYAGVRFMHLALYGHSARQGHASWEAIAGFSVTVTVGMMLLVAGSLLDTPWQVALWTVAVIIDYAGPGLLTRRRLRGLQHVAVAHFADRYGAFIIICLGESIVAIGLSATREPLGAQLVAMVGLGLVITIGLWWIYFGRVAAAAAARLGDREEPVLAASDAYSYLHLALVAGIIIFAVGMRHAVLAVDEPLAENARLALCGGLALYLIGHIVFVARLLGSLRYEKLVAAAALLTIFAVAGGWRAWVVVASDAAVIALLCASEALGSGQRSMRPGRSDPGSIALDDPRQRRLSYLVE
jgi:low temperature requirement protein LtrA